MTTAFLLFIGLMVLMGIITGIIFKFGSDEPINDTKPIEDKTPKRQDNKGEYITQYVRTVIPGDNETEDKVFVKPVKVFVPKEPDYIVKDGIITMKNGVTMKA